MKGFGAGVRAISYYLPPKVVDNKALVEEFGTWTEEKIYQKTVDVGTLPADGNKSVAHGIANLAAIVGCSGVANNLPALAVPDSHVVLSIYLDQTNVHIQGDPLLSGFCCVVTVWYTCSNR